MLSSTFLSDNLKSAVLATARLVLHQHHRRQRGNITDAANDVIMAASQTKTNTRKYKRQHIIQHKIQLKQKSKKGNITNEEPLYSSSTFLISLNDL